MNTDSFFYSETLDELYREKEAIASTYNSLADYCAHLKAIEDSMMARGLSFYNRREASKLPSGDTDIFGLVQDEIDHSASHDMASIRDNISRRRKSVRHLK